MRIASRRYRDAAQLAEIERRLQGASEPALWFERACCLEDLGWDDAAAEAYRAILTADPRHLGAQTNLATMLHERGDVRGARRLFAQAVASEPLVPLAHANLAKALVELGEFAAAHTHYARALELEPGNFAAAHGLALAFEAQGDRAEAERWFARAFAERAWWTVPSRAGSSALRVLLLVSGRGGDVVTHPFLDDRWVETTMLVPDGVSPGTPLPPHDVVFNGIGDADRCAPSLERARALLATVPGAINEPERVLATGRVDVARRLGRIPGVRVPRIERLRRDAISGAGLAAAGWAYPMLLRSLGHHAGRAFERVDGPDGLEAALAAIPGDEVLAIAFLDTRGADGAYRKYRAIFAGGRTYVLHLAIARRWKVHYFSADMRDDAAHREEERRCLDDPATELGPGASATLDAIGDALGLDYGGVDFAFDDAGRMVVFEANATMAVYPPEPDPRWAYRLPAYDAVVEAMRRLLLERAAASRTRSAG